MATINPSNAGIQISPYRFISQWRDAIHKFRLNLWNFEVKAGKAAKNDFQTSFAIKKFNSSGSSTWPSRSKNNHATHPLMIETGSLKNSIKWKHTGTQNNPSGVLVYTDPDGFAFANKHQGFCYAAVHNGDDYFRRGAVKNMPRRQFMGYSTEVKNDLLKLSVEIFKGFPK